MLSSLSVVLEIRDFCLQDRHSLDHVVVLVHLLFELLDAIHQQLVVIYRRDDGNDDC